ncbi:MAG: hypothetical protein H7321_05920 [Bacteroidia bacterium]|nr:hypothetical protein [Bacteroidia bacterium]
MNNPVSKNYFLIILTMLTGLTLPFLSGGLLYSAQSEDQAFSSFIYGILHQAAFFLDFYQVGIAILIGFFILSINKNWYNISRGLIGSIMAHVVYVIIIVSSSIK